jgi:murein DD-endopeptidase MepM/ murein hydrolase activator NlpD
MGDKTVKLAAAVLRTMGSRVKNYQGGVRQDYKRLATDNAPHSPVRWGPAWFLLGLIPPLAIAMVFLSEDNPPVQEVAATAVLEPLALLQPNAGARTPLSIPVPMDAPEVAVETSPFTPLAMTVKKGDTAEILFRRHGLSLGDLANMVRLPEVKPHLTIVKPGQVLQIEQDAGAVATLTKELNDFQLLRVVREGNGFSAHTIEREVEIRQVGSGATIQSSLFEAGKAAGISDQVIMNMAGIFQWDVDFILDVRSNDEFFLLYEELWRDGTKLRDGEIVAAEFVNRGESFRAVRYIDGEGRSDYFTPDGRSVRKAFVRAPLDFTRVSSNFNPRRKHPILNKIRAHRGVDYAAGRGTPVMAAGDGKVIFRGTKNGYGNTVILQHGGNITTLYAHLSKFAGKARNGRRVKQGQVIAYVGKTGLATAPHLHYEYRVAGVHRNPRTVKLPPAEPVPTQYRDDFLAASEPVWRQLDLYRRTRLAATN